MKIDIKYEGGSTNIPVRVGGEDREKLQVH